MENLRNGTPSPNFTTRSDQGIEAIKKELDENTFKHFQVQHHTFDLSSKTEGVILESDPSNEEYTKQIATT
jgi:hypothetical protein